MERWKAIAGEGTEQQIVFASERVVDLSLLNYIKSSLVPSMRMMLADGLDNEKTATASAQFLMSGGAPALAVLMRLESDAAQQKFRLTIRAGHAKVAVSLKALVLSHLAVA